MAVIYVRAPDEVADYFRQLSDASGLPMSKIVTMLIEDARRRGWSVTVTGNTTEGET